MMHDKLKKVLGKKRNLSDNEKHAKMDVLKDLRDSAAEAMGHRLNKVSVLSDSPEGLKKGLDKAKEVVSSKEFDGMRKHAENPYGDYKSAMEEHEGEEEPEHMSDGGPVLDQDKLQSAQDSMRKAFKFNEGGEVESEEDEESPEHEMEESPEEEASEHDNMSEEELDKKLEELMALKRKMEAQKS